MDVALNASLKSQVSQEEVDLQKAIIASQQEEEEDDILEIVRSSQTKTNSQVFLNFFCTLLIFLGRTSF